MIKARILALCLIVTFAIFCMVSCTMCYVEEMYEDEIEIPVETEEYEEYSVSNGVDEEEESAVELPITILPPREYHEYEDEGEIDGDIRDFLASGDITLHITGRASVDEIGIRVMNNTTSRINIYLPAGLYFAAERDNVHDMVLTESMNVFVSAAENTSIIANVRVVETDSVNDIPSMDDVFFIDKIITN